MHIDATQLALGDSEPESVEMYSRWSLIFFLISDRHGCKYHQIRFWENDEVVCVSYRRHVMKFYQKMLRSKKWQTDFQKNWILLR